MQLHFANNTASFGGDDILYGGWVGITNYLNNNESIVDHDIIDNNVK